MPRLPTDFITALLLLPLAQIANGQLFTVNCAPLTIQRSDPIVSPGVPSGHVHAIIGGTAFQRTMSQTTAVNARTTTCDKKLDKSNYWVPQLYHIRGDGTFEIVPFQGSAVYYLNRACDFEPGRTQCDPKFNSKAPPAGLRMLAGNPSLRTYNPSSFAQNAILYTCLKTGPNTPETSAFPNEPCLRLRAEVFFPSCWNGRDLDSADHKSHMAYPAIGGYNVGVCPASHPVAILSVFFEFYFFTEPFPDHKFVYAMGDTTGYGLHGDFLNGWDQGALERSLATCQGPQGAYDPNCSINAGQGSASQETLEVAAPVEDVGLNGSLRALPGNNPVSKRSRVFGTSF